MNAGLSNLDLLKRQLLAPALRATTTYDDQLLALGRGLAITLENYCNRKFARVENDTVVCTADRDHFYVPRLPLETFSGIELKADINVGWEPQTGLVLNTNEASGLIYWGAGISYQWAQMRITYTGGYFWETLEPDAASYPSAQPAGSAVIPDDLQLAWLLQCKHVWETIDPRGVKIVGGGGDSKGVPQQFFGDLDLVPQVKTMLGQFIRYAML